MNEVAGFHQRKAIAMEHKANQRGFAGHAIEAGVLHIPRYRPQQLINVYGRKEGLGKRVTHMPCHLYLCQRQSIDGCAVYPPHGKVAGPSTPPPPPVSGPVARRSRLPALARGSRRAQCSRYPSWSP